MISIIIPVIREEKAQNCINACLDDMAKNAETIECEILHFTDDSGIGCPAMVAQLVEKARGDMIMFLGDDTIPQPGFLESALDAMNSLPDGWGVVGLNTQDDRPGVGFNDHAHWMAHRKMLDHIPGGEFFSTDYRHCYGDDELKDIAFELGRWTVAKDCRILHDHPVNATAEYGEGYQKAYDNGAVFEDWKTYCRRKIKRRGFRVAIALPESGKITDKRFQSSYRQAIYTYLKCEGTPQIKEYEPDVPIGQFTRDIANNRNDVFYQALADGMSHVIMTDTDQILPSDLFIKLATHAARGKQCVIAPVHRRYEPFELILMRGEDPDHFLTVPDEEKYSGKLIEVDSGGGGCFMVDMLAVLDIYAPWFSLDEKTPGGGDMGEDIAFFWKIRKAGHRIWADTSIEIGHITDIIVNKEFHLMWEEMNRRFMEAQKKNKAA